MRHTYHIEGMTCNNCVANVTEKLLSISGIKKATVDLASKSATIEMEKHIDIDTLAAGLPTKFTISEKAVHMPISASVGIEEKTKLQQLKPLFIILAYIAVAVILMHRGEWNNREMMMDFMGLFLIVFSFFKMLDIKGFATTFSMYDPIASRVSIYGNVYPFIETILGIMLLMRYEVNIALAIMIAVLAITTYGVTKTLLAKRTIKCACLGTALNLPMTEATFIENSIMIIMGVVMLAF